MFIATIHGDEPAGTPLVQRLLNEAQTIPAPEWMRDRQLIIIPIANPDGYALTTERSTAWLFKQRKTITAKHVVLAASSLGTMDLLMRAKQRGSLPDVSARLGHDVRTLRDLSYRLAGQEPRRRIQTTA